jgi:hypothetical protein
LKRAAMARETAGEELDGCPGVVELPSKEEELKRSQSESSSPRLFVGVTTREKGGALGLRGDGDCADGEGRGGCTDRKGRMFSPAAGTLAGEEAVAVGGAKGGPPHDASSASGPTTGGDGIGGGGGGSQRQGGQLRPRPAR